MVKVRNLKKLLRDDVIDVIYMGRLESLSIITTEDKENINELLEDRKKAYAQIDAAINNIPNEFTETRNYIRESIDNYLEIVNAIAGYENEKFYKAGFCDGISVPHK